MQRNIFTDAPTRAERLADMALAVVIGLALAAGALAYFDILTY